MKRIYYCKSRKKTGKPIVVQDMETGKETYRKRIKLNNVNIEMKFGNSRGKAKSRGSTTVLEVYENE